MSRVGKRPIAIPTGVDVTVDGDQVSVKGPKGQLSERLPAEISVSVQDGQIEFHLCELLRESFTAHPNLL